MDENMSEELAVLQEELLQLHNSLIAIRFEIAKASAKARGLLQGVADILKHLVRYTTRSQSPVLTIRSQDADELHSPDAPVTPTCPSLPWKDYSAEFKGNADAQEMDTIDSELYKYMLSERRLQGSTPSPSYSPALPQAFMA
ncbi:unnamed protein product [Fusarium fujikuroi]|nr:hypothetical protein CEK25_002132 [Fusarium fujikuroi]VTT74808.1 unnamed protein product [Fusarium fujikuroi]VZI00217.1 unnamed protein product [Fusarium fujikuroi]